MGQPIRGFNLSLPRWAAFVLMLGALVLLAQTAVLSLLGVGGIKAYAKPLFPTSCRLPWCSRLCGNAAK